MRRAIFFTAAAAFLVVPAMAQAQTGPTEATVTASAVIDGFAEFTDTDADLAFGTITAGATGAAVTVETTSADAAVLGVRHNVGFDYSFTGLNAPLENADGEQLPITHYCEWVAQGGSAAGSTTCGNGSSGFDGVGVQTGELRIGGQLGDTNVSAGEYTGELTVNINVTDS